MISLEFGTGITHADRTAPSALASWPAVGGEPSSRPAGLAIRFLRLLSKADLSVLSNFASFRLSRIGLPAADGQDLVQDALLAVLKGVLNRSEGRHPRPVDLAGMPAFIHYLKGVIISLVDAQRRHRRTSCVSDSFEEQPAKRARLAGAHTQQVELVDFTNELFSRMLDRAPGHLRDLVRAWKDDWEHADTIPILGRHRRRRREVRLLARQVLKEILQPQKRSGAYEQPR